MFKGIAVSPGVVVGIAHRVDTVFGSGEPQYLADPAMTALEIERFEHALAISATELEGLVAKVSEQLGASEADIFQSHLQIVHDRTLLSKVRALIETQCLTAMSALQAVLQDYAATLARSEHEYFRERMTDIRDVISRIGSHLALSSAPAIAPEREGDEPIVLVTHEILPSQAMSLGSLPIAGIVTEAGGGTSHAAILARGRGIPAVSGVVGITSEVQTGDPIVVDGREGLVLVRPDAEAVAAYRKLQREFFDLKDRLVLNRDKPAVSADGVPIELLANVNTVADTQSADMVGAAGVGLFRTEYLFLTHQDVPDEQEQYEYYRQIVEASPELRRDDPHPRPRRRQDRALSRPARRGQPVHGLAVDPLDV